jgi:predicted transcriptional regulator
MQRTTIVAPEALLERLRRIAAERHVSLATVIREALEERAAREQPKPKAIGIFDSGHTDTARLAGDWKYEPPAWR